MKQVLSFRLLTEYHSFLSININDVLELLFNTSFPSPYGVSFILMDLIFQSYNTVIAIISFRLLTEYHSFLFYLN